MLRHLKVVYVTEIQLVVLFLINLSEMFVSKKIEINENCKTKKGAKSRAGQFRNRFLILC
jgi:hypothetical protein